MKYVLKKGIVFRINNSGVADKIISLVTQSGSRLSFVAKGIRKSKSRKSQLVDLGNFISFKLIDKYNLPIVTEINLEDEYIEWKKDFVSITVLQFICELLDKFLYEENDEKQIFDLLKSVLDNHQKDKLINLIIFFSINLLDIVGFLPAIKTCTVTGQELKPGKVFADSIHIGFVSDKADTSKEKVSDLVYKIVCFANRNNLLEVKKLDIKLGEQKVILGLLLNWLEIASEKRIKSKEILYMNLF